MSDSDTPKNEQDAFIKAKTERENPFLNIIFNIFLPIFILNKGTGLIGPFWALILALSFPMGFGLYDWWKRKKTNFFSILGLLNIAFTGGLALSGLTGIWFAIKEAAFPGLIGLFVLISAFTRRPVIQKLFLNPQLIDVELLQTKVEASQRQHDFFRLLKMSTILLSFSFALSAFLNFYLAARIFKPLDLQLQETARSEILNTQIAEMTQWSFVVILLPSMAVLLLVFAYLIRGLKQITGLNLDQILRKN